MLKSIKIYFSLFAVSLFIWACAKAPEQTASPINPAPVVQASSPAEDSGAVSAPVQPGRTAPIPYLKTNQWPEFKLNEAVVHLKCDGVETQPSEQEKIAAGVDISYEFLEEHLTPCAESGGVELSYQGKINSEFTELMGRTSAMADQLNIKYRLLNINSTGGQVEEAMRAGDGIAASRWIIRVAEKSICHSACVLVLAAGDDRELTGRVGIHRMVRIGSKANSRAELTDELREVYTQMKSYLERNGASVAVADLMMTVPNRSLRVLNTNELVSFGLLGENAVQADLDRILLTRKCGDEFVKRLDAYDAAYNRECMRGDIFSTDVGEPELACGLALRARFGFPDSSCPADSPLAEFDVQRSNASEQVSEANANAVD